MNFETREALTDGLNRVLKEHERQLQIQPHLQIWGCSYCKLHGWILPRHRPRQRMLEQRVLPCARHIDKPAGLVHGFEGAGRL